MPFSGPSDPTLPDRIKPMSLAKRRQWVGAWNGSFADCQKKGEGDCEGRAFRIANAAIKETEMPEDKTVDIDQADHSEDDEGAEKHMHEEGSWHPAFGARTWDEFQVAEDAEEKMFEILDVTHTFKNIVTNILNDPMLSPDETADFLDQAVAGIRPKLVAIKELESVEGQKQATKTEDGIAFRARDFAVVPDPEKPSGWKLRLAEGSSGNVTRAQIARAITAMQPSGFRGQRVQLAAGDKTQAVRRITAAINRASGTDDQKVALRARLDRVKEGGVIHKATKVIQDWLDKGKADPATSEFAVFKDKAGEYRWIATVTNRWRDRDVKPEIFEEKAHKNFIKYLDDGGFMPELWLWHTPGTDIGKADWASYDGGFLVASGFFGKEHQQTAENLSKMKGLGVSHGYHYTYSDEERGIIGEYKTFEISPLPLERAANVFTGFDILSKEASMEIGATKRAWLVGVIGEEKVAAMEKNHTTLEAALDEAGIESKDLPEEPESDEKGDTGTTAEEGKTGLFDGKILTDLASGMKELTDGVKSLTETVATYGKDMEAVKARLDELEKSDDEKVAATLTAKVNGATTGHRASDSDKNLQSPEEAKKEEGPVSVIDQKIYESLTQAPKVPVETA